MIATLLQHSYALTLVNVYVLLGWEDIKAGLPPYALFRHFGTGKGGWQLDDPAKTNAAREHPDDEPLSDAVAAS